MFLLVKRVPKLYLKCIFHIQSQVQISSYSHGPRCSSVGRPHLGAVALRSHLSLFSPPPLPSLSHSLSPPAPACLSLLLPQPTRAVPSCSLRDQSCSPAGTLLSHPPAGTRLHFQPSTACLGFIMCVCAAAPPAEAGRGGGGGRLVARVRTKKKQGDRG